MIYLSIQIFGFMLAAAIIGGLVGWFMRDPRRPLLRALEDPDYMHADAFCREKIALANSGLAQKDQRIAELKQEIERLQQNP